MIADNRPTETSEWDERLLGENLKILADLELDFDLGRIGFDYGEIEHRITSLDELGDDARDVGAASAGVRAAGVPVLVLLQLSPIRSDFSFNSRFLAGCGTGKPGAFRRS